MCTCKIKSALHHSRSAAELDGGEGTGSTVGVGQQLGNGNADGHDSDRVGVRLVEHGAQTLDRLGFCERCFHRVHGLDSYNSTLVLNTITNK